MDYTLTISLGWWIVPTLITFISYAGATYYGSSKISGDPFAMAFELFAALFLYGCATIVSLLSWVIYLVLV